MLDFESYYPAAKKYFLSENYRCAPEIVAAAGKVISENKTRICKEIVSRIKTVYLPSVNEGVIPGSRIVTPEEFEEERRLFYVGMTRAEKSLHISWCLEEFSEKLTPSRFIKPLM